MPCADGSDHTVGHMEFLAIAERLARGAGALTVRLRAEGGSLGVDAKSSPTDVVTEVDRASERWLADELARLRPDDALLGEEGADRPSGLGTCRRAPKNGANRTEQQWPRRLSRARWRACWSST
jgi:3'-phosphoadenosine 5'-phosphosulfate (PAPS) 3'-phosphatase